MIYTKFRNTVVQEPTTERLLPIEPAEPHVTMAPEYIFEPSPEAVLKEVLYGFTEVQVLQAVYESIASEFSARMVAMRNATESANELIGELTLSYNKARQEAITKELLDIVGGSSALQQAA
jgi:F-type H+-transporting ATPase subunit gamma